MPLEDDAHGHPPPPPDDAAAPQGREDRFLDDYLLFLLASVSAAASEEVHAIVRAHGLKVPEWRVLACLHDRDGQMVTRLAALALMEQSRLTRVLERMDERGLISRRGDADDRRRVRVHLTAKGAALAQNMVAQARAHEARTLALLPVARARQLKATLRRLQELLGAVTPTQHDEPDGDTSAS